MRPRESVVLWRARVVALVVPSPKGPPAPTPHTTRIAAPVPEVAERTTDATTYATMEGVNASPLPVLDRPRGFWHERGPGWPRSRSAPDWCWGHA